MRQIDTEYFDSEEEAVERMKRLKASAIPGYSEVYVTGPSFDESRGKWRIGITVYSG